MELTPAGWGNASLTGAGTLIAPEAG